MTENEIISAIKRVKAQLKEGYVDLGAHDEDEIEVVRQAMTALGAIGQYKWERDVAFKQLNELGTQFGLKTDGMKAVNLDELAESVEDKMTYMCGCRNCIETVTQIIKGDRKPFDSQCNECGNKDCKSKNGN